MFFLLKKVGVYVEKTDRYEIVARQGCVRVVFFMQNQGERSGVNPRSVTVWKN